MLHTLWKRTAAGSVLLLALILGLTACNDGDVVGVSPHVFDGDLYPDRSWPDNRRVNPKIDRGMVTPFVADCFALAPTINAELALIGLNTQRDVWSVHDTFIGTVGHAFHTSGIAMTDDLIIAPGYTENGNQWLQVDRSGGTITLGSQTMSDAVATDGSDLFAFCGGPGQPSVCRYSDFTGLSSNQALNVVGDIPTTTRLTVHDGTVYAAWHATDHLELLDMASLSRSQLFLDNFDGWVLGMSIVGDELFILGLGTDEDRAGTSRVTVFDRTTGTQLRHTLIDFDPDQLSHPLSGLACVDPSSE